jgi:phasin family protein
VQQFGGDGSTEAALKARNKPMTEQQTATGLAQMTKATDVVANSAQKACAFGRGNLEATARAVQTYLAGTQSLGRQGFDVAQALNRQAFEGAKAMAAAKSVREAVEIQTSLVRSAIERSLSEGTKLHQAAMKLAEEVYAPLTHRATMAFEAVSRPIAA